MPCAVLSIFIRKLAVACVIGFLGICAPIVLADRQLPTDAFLAKSATFNYPSLRANGKTLHMGVGSRIYDQNNRIILPVAVPPKINVLFKIDMNGDVSRVWILTDQEAAGYARKK